MRRSPFGGTTEEDVTELLERWSRGDEGAVERLIPLVYQELRRIAGRQMRRSGRRHTLQTTELVHETYLSLLGQGRSSWQNRVQFYSVAALLMRRVLLRRLEKARTGKRGGRWRQVALEPQLAWTEAESEELLTLHEALERLRDSDPRQARVAELRLYLGCAIEEIAEQLRVSRSTVQREWRMARAWLGQQLRGTKSSRRLAANG